MAAPVGPKISPFSSAGVCARVRAERVTGVLGEDRVHPVPERLVDDRLVLAGIGRALVHRLPEVDPVVEQLVEVALVDELAALRPHALAPQLPRQHRRRADPDEALEDPAHDRGVGLVHHQLAVLDVVAERHVAAHPHALLRARPRSCRGCARR